MARIAASGRMGPSCLLLCHTVSRPAAGIALLPSIPSTQLISAVLGFYTHSATHIIALLYLVWESCAHSHGSTAFMVGI